MSSIRLFGTMRPTNRKFVSPSSRIFESAGCGGAFVMRVQVQRDGEDARRAEAQRLELPAVVVRVAERQVGVTPTSDLQVGAAEGRDPEHLRVVVGEEVGRRDVVVLQHAGAARGRGTRADIGDGSA